MQASQWSSPFNFTPGDDVPFAHLRGADPDGAMYENGHSQSSTPEATWNEESFPTPSQNPSKPGELELSQLSSLSEEEQVTAEGLLSSMSPSNPNTFSFGDTSPIRPKKVRKTAEESVIIEGREVALSQLSEECNSNVERAVRAQNALNKQIREQRQKERDCASLDDYAEKLEKASSAEKAKILKNNSPREAGVVDLITPTSDAGSVRSVTTLREHIEEGRRQNPDSKAFDFLAVGKNRTKSLAQPYNSKPAEKRPENKKPVPQPGVAVNTLQHTLKVFDGKWKCGTPTALSGRTGIKKADIENKQKCLSALMREGVKGFKKEINWIFKLEPKVFALFFHPEDRTLELAAERAFTSTLGQMCQKANAADKAEGEKKPAAKKKPAPKKRAAGKKRSAATATATTENNK